MFSLNFPSRSDGEQNFQSIRLRPHAFLVRSSFGDVRSSFGECAPCQFNPAEFFACTKLGTYSTGKGARWMYGSYALACVLFGRLLTRNAWKVTNNGCETVVHGTKLMTYIFWGIIKVTGTKTFSKRSKNVLSVVHTLRLRFTRYLSVTRTVMSVNCPHLALFSLRTESDNPDATCELSP